MKNRFTQAGQGPVPTERNDAQRGLALHGALAFAVAILAAALAGAEEPQRVAQAKDPEPPPATSDSAAEPDPVESDPTEPDPAEPDSTARGSRRSSCWVRNRRPRAISGPPTP